MHPVPSALDARPFTGAEAAKHGLTSKSLQSRQFRRLFRNVYVRATVELTLVLWIKAALLVLPVDAALSHVTAMWWHGAQIGAWWPLQFSTNTATRSKRDGIVVHRRLGRLNPRWYHGVLALGVDRTFVDCATQYTFVQLVQAGDMLLHLGRTTHQRLIDYADNVHIDGVRRARLALAYVCEGVESPMETTVRLMLILARLPRPECNREVLDEVGRFVARCDLVYPAYRVIVEYDGRWHERSPRQRQRDHTRLEELTRLGWTVIVVTSEDLKHKRNVVHRVHQALRAHGYTGQEPLFNIMWDRWFR